MVNEHIHFVETAQRLNRIRFARALAILSPLKRDLLRLIPLFFHYHRLGYPGYNGPLTPYGIFGYKPSDSELSACDTLGLIRPDLHLVNHSTIDGVYSMGSMSSFGQNAKSDVDIWLVHDPLLSANDCRLLEEKSELISTWFSQYGFEVNIYLVHPEQFIKTVDSAGELQSSIGLEHSGSAQHWLLLEEFYRSQICFAGKTVAWWPNAQRSDELLFLGHVSQIPASEYFGASLWQLYKGLEKPHKALLKVLLLEAYASQYPQTCLVSDKVWQRTIEGDFSAENDAYFLLYESIETYLLKQGDLRRLEIVRQCFYLKCGLRLSDKVQTKDWRYHKFSKLVAGWDWSNSVLQTLDYCEDWHCGQLQWFNEQLNELMLGSYQTLLKFASIQKLSKSLKLSELGLLTRKLHTYFSSDIQQIISLNRLWSDSISEADLTIIFSHNDNEYCLYRCKPEPRNFIGQRAVYRSHSKAKLMAWACLNGVSSELTHWYDLSVSKRKSVSLIKASKRLVAFFGSAQIKVSKMDFCQPWRYKKLMFLLNFNSDSTAQWQGQEIMVDYMNANIFSLGRDQQNMLESIDIICLNSWGEWHCHHYEGQFCVLDTLTFITGGIRRTTRDLAIEVISCSVKLASQFERTLGNLIQRTVRLSLQVSSSATLVYPLKVSGVEYGLFFNSKGMVYRNINDKNELFQQLTKKKLIELPRPNLGDEPFSKIPEVIQDFAARGAIQYFLRQGAQGLDVFILNENNELEYYKQSGFDIDELVSQVSHHHAFAEFGTSQQRFNLPQFFRLLRVDGRLRALPFGVSVDEIDFEF
ncbi:class I adenylate cyclase [Shewanella sp. VB17]|uniref:class I adenylate cyclase n=1 Tax=Shewanella sp. VB17 TaxID=2739432 RepID=UPI00156490E6|nr:class I adenylate cyclase [Shewanella sp. VB17]NRD75746.1 class I adenylate cyclase [Shewanella sp. VB17]